MPGRKTHAYVGLIAGLGYTAFQAKEQSTANFSIEAAGGAFGGWWGGQLPDVFEPATSSWHRCLAHSGTTGAAIVSARSKLTGWQDYCRERAESCLLKREALNMVPHPSRPDLFVAAPTDQWEHFLLFMQEVLWRFAAGIANGLAAGYVSHLALDATTPRSIPLLMGRF
jgi:hypothetical protein